MRQFYVYILTNETGTLYAGVTNDLQRRVQEHKASVGSEFTKQYHIDRLVYFEVLPDAKSAIAREKQIKGYRRDKKLALIREFNPTWADLSVTTE
ncbi:MAG: GIY-YIG nuclease family protein [Anaerolineae bacterium]|nr:GIY-YIG nuclease family protein [Anaerolineae bacterium]